jgi:DNA-binding XRE family transcriptional regulator
VDENETGRTGSGSGTPKGRKRAPRKDPQGFRTNPDRKLQIAIGREVRALRRDRQMTYAALASASGLSIGMLSKIENGMISPSLTTLQSLGAALSVPVTQFFRRYEDGSSPGPDPAPDAPMPPPD